MVFGKGCGVCGDEPLAGIQFEKIQAIIRIFVSYLLAVSLLTHKICKERPQDISNMIGLLGLIRRGRFDDHVARETRQDMVLLALCVPIELETTS